MELLFQATEINGASFQPNPTFFLGGALLHFHEISSYSGIFFHPTRSFAPHIIRHI
jgi:hypothetical protein